MNASRTSAVASLTLALFAATAVSAEYLAHAVGKGSRVPLPESVEGIDAHYLVDLGWGYKGGRSTITVAPVVDARGAARPGAEAGPDVPLEAIHAAVVGALRGTGRFEVHAGPADAASRAPAGGDTLQVSVATYEAGAVARVINPRARRAQGPQVQTGRVGLRMRLVGPAGEVKVVDHFEASVDEPRPGLADIGVADGLPADISTTSIGQAMLAAVNKGVYEIVKALGPLPVSGLVVKVEEVRVWVNLGGGAVSVGDELEVTAKGEALVDPETGIELGGLETTLATARVIQVEERFSVAELQSGTGIPTRGDHVRSKSGSGAFKFAPHWDPAAKDAF